MSISLAKVSTTYENLKLEDRCIGYLCLLRLLFRFCLLHFPLWLRLCLFTLRLLSPRYDTSLRRRFLIGNNLRDIHFFGILGTIRNGNRSVVLILVSCESLVDATGDIIHPSIIVEQALFIRSGDETQLYEASRHGSLSQDQESRLMHALIGTVGTIADPSLNHSSQFYASLHVLALDELEDDIAL